MKSTVALALVGLLAFSAIGAAQSSPGDVTTLESELATLRLTYTDGHPLVRAQLARIERARSAAQELTRLESELSTLRLTYTDAHPLVKALTERIASQQPDALLQSARQELARLLLVYTDQHPAVLAQMDRIRALEQK